MQQLNGLKRTQRLLIASGALLMFFGGVAGFGFLFFLLGEIRLWPFPTIEYQMPGSIKAWRMTHLEGMLGGLLHWLLAALLPLMPFALITLRRMSLAVIAVGWMFTVASLMDAIFTDSRGLAIGGPLTNSIAFFLFYVGIVMIMYIFLAIAYRSLTAKD